MKQDNIVIETDIFYIPDSDESNNGIGNYYSYEKQGSTYLGKTYIVNPYKVKEYNQEFNTWLRKCIHGELILEIDGISTDLVLDHMMKRIEICADKSSGCR